MVLALNSIDINNKSLKEKWSLFTLDSLCVKKNQGVNTTVEGVTYSEKGYPVIRAKNIQQNQIDYNDIVCVDKKTFDRIRIDCKPAYGDILYTNIGSQFGNASVVQDKEPFVIAWNVLRIQPKKDLIDPHFLSYLLNANRLRITSLNSSSTMSFVNGQELGKLEFAIPQLEIQKSIIHQLGTLDAKIKLNYRLNTTLEAVGAALFRRWFVDFEFPNQEGKPYKTTGGKMVYEEELDTEIPEGWEAKPIDEVAIFLNGLALQKFPAKEGKEYLPVIKIRELRQGITESSDRANLDVPKEYVVNDGDILFSWSGSLEVVIWGFGKGALNQHLFKVTSGKYPKWFFYYWLLRFLPEYRAIASDKATTMGHIQRHHLSASKVLIPDEKTLEKMDNVLSSIIERRARLQVESRLLAEIRDCLLPKLMSGKIRVPINKDSVEVS